MTGEIDNARIWNFLKRHGKTRPLFEDIVPCDSRKKGRRFPYALVKSVDDWRSWRGAQRPSHWVAILVVDSDHAEYFDSSGSVPNACILENLKDFRHLKTNALQLQAYGSSTCGFYCMYFILRRAEGVDFDSVIEELASKRGERDEYVKNFIVERERDLYKTS